MTALWFGAAALTAAALAFLLVPLWRQRRSSGRWSWTAIVAAVLVVPFTFALYSHVRTYDPDVAERVATEQALVAMLAERMSEDPSDPQGWRMLGRLYVSMGDYGSAVMAYEQAWQRTERRDNEFKLDYAEAQFLADQTTLVGEGGRIVEEVLAQEPANARALWYGGLRALMSGDQTTARDRLGRLLALGELPPELEPVIREQLMRIDGAAEGGSVAGAAAAESASGVTAPGVTASGGTASARTSGEAAGTPRIGIEVSLGAPFDSESFGSDAVLFIFARAAAGGPPVAALRVPASALPGRFELTDQHAMLPGASLADHDTLRIVARISASGQPLEQPGDLYGEAEAKPESGAGVALVIDRRVE